MTAPVGLTRAEEEREQQLAPAPRAVVIAPPGAARCRASVLPTGAACPAEARVLVRWSDGDGTPMCVECAGRTQQLAQSYRAAVRVEPLG